MENGHYDKELTRGFRKQICTAADSKKGTPSWENNVIYDEFVLSYDICAYSVFLYNIGQSIPHCTSILDQILAYNGEKKQIPCLEFISNKGTTSVSCSYQINSYKIKVLKKETFRIHNYLIFEFTLIDNNYKDNHNKDEIGIKFSLFDTEGPIGIYFETVKINEQGVFHLHAIVDHKECENKKALINIVISSVYNNLAEQRDLSMLINEGACTLSTLINELKSKDTIRCEAPKNNESRIIIPLNCSFSNKYFAKLYLLKECEAVKQIVSQYGVFQYQIAINKDDEEAILIACGEHFLKNVYDELQPAYGKSLIEQDLRYLTEVSPILRIIQMGSELIDQNNLQRTESYCRFEESIRLLHKWIKENTSYFLNEYKKNNSKTIKWRNEYKLFRFIKFFFPDAIFQYHIDWLGDQSYDVFIPSRNVAVEYQGRQHYEEIAFFGGKDNYYDNRDRDKRKQQLSIKHGVILFEWKYTEKVNFVSVKQFIKDRLNESFSIEEVENRLNENLPLRIKDLFVV